MKNRLILPDYKIYFEGNFNALNDLLLEAISSKTRLMVVFDSNTAKFYKESFLSHLKTTFFNVFSFVFTAGEASKNLLTVENLYEELVKKQFDRNDMLLAFGGGVVGDLAGFAAATYLRGIRFIQIPSTLLSMSDSGIGGKTGVDFKSYKNMVGAFHQPSLVYMNLHLLETLADREYLSGMAEIIKAAYIKDKNLLTQIEQQSIEIIDRKYTELFPILYRACEIKKEVVEADPHEKGERALLNFGHTIGHAIEKLLNFEFLHGECVSLGMLAATKISIQKGFLSSSHLQRMKSILHSYHLPTKLNLKKYSFSIEDIIAATKLDKKMDAGKIKFILLEEEGKAVIDTTVTDEDLFAGIQEIIE